MMLQGSRFGYASIGRRVLAMFLDGILFFILCLVANHLIPFLGGVFVFLFYAPVLESSQISATLGKYWVGIQVVDLSGRRISFSTALIRNLMKIVSSFILFLGYFIAFFTERRQALHDLVADTIVIHGRNDSIAVIDAWIEELKVLFRSQFPNRDSMEGKLSELERLHALKEKGILTEEEFQKGKEKILK